MDGSLLIVTVVKLVVLLILQIQQHGVRSQAASGPAVSAAAAAAAAAAAREDTRGFCGRLAPPTQRVCPAPPSASSLDLTTLVGSYFEIGSTARFKIRNELGMVCTRTQFALTHYDPRHVHIPDEGPLSRTLTINVSRSGVPISLDHHALAAVSHIASSASSICSSTAQLCDLLSLHDGLLSEAVLRLSTISPQILHTLSANSSISSGGHALTLTQVVDLINTSVVAIQTRLDRVVRSVHAVAGINAALSQNPGGPGSTVDALLHTLRISVANGLDATREAGAFTVNNLTYAVDMIEGVASHLHESSSAVRVLNEASSYINQEMDSVASKVTSVEGLLNNIAGPLADLVAAGSNTTSTPATNTTVARVVLTSGQAFHVNAGLRPDAVFRPVSGATFSGTGSATPFRILAVEGGEPATMGEYSAALIYVCDTADTDANDPQSDLVILSRTPTLQPQTVNSFLDIAASYGLVTDCDSPFIPSVQRASDDDCGAANV